MNRDSPLLYSVVLLDSIVENLLERTRTRFGDFPLPSAPELLDARRRRIKRDDARLMIVLHRLAEECFSRQQYRAVDRIQVRPAAVPVSSQRTAAPRIDRTVECVRRFPGCGPGKLVLLHRTQHNPTSTSRLLTCDPDSVLH